MRFPPAGGPCHRRRRRFTRAVENGSRFTRLALDPDISILTLLWVDSEKQRSCTAMEQNNPLSYSSKEFGPGWMTQMWKITFQMSANAPIAPTSLCNSSAPRYVPHFPRPIEFDDTWINFIFFSSQEHPQKKKKTQTQRDSWNLEIAAMAACFHPPMAPSPLKSSHRKWIDLAL